MTERDNSPAAAGEKDEADAIWNEIQTGKADPADAERPSNEEAADDAGDQTDTGEDFAKSGSDDDTDPADGAEGGPDDGGGAEADDDEDIWDSVPEKVRTQFEEIRAKSENLEQANKSIRGRLMASDRKLAQLSETAKPAKGEESDEARIAKLEQFKEDYPDIADVLQGQIDTIEGRLSELQEDRQRAEKDRVSGEQSRILDEHPDAPDLLKQYGGYMAGWIEDQPLAVREAFQRNSKKLVHAETANLVFSEFKKHLAEEGLMEPPENSGKSKAADRRERQKAAADSPSHRRTGPSRSGIPKEGDPDSIWNAIQREKAEKERRRTA